MQMELRNKNFIEVQVVVSETIDVNLSLQDLLIGLQSAPLTDKWQAVFLIIDKINFAESEDERLTPEQSARLKTFLKKKLEELG